MRLTLQLVNEATLADGGSVSVDIDGKRGIDIGRAAHLDWCLPDPTRYISSKHCEIRYKDGGYWLHDVSTNGTFLNGADHRMHAPHRLRTGDRFIIGQYIVAATVEEDHPPADSQTQEPSPAARSVNDEDWWATDGVVPPPIDPKELRPARNQSPVNPDFLDWAADVLGPYRESPPNRSSAPTKPSSLPPDLDWAVGPPSRLPVPPPPPPPIPTPRRPTQDRGDFALTVPAPAAASPPELDDIGSPRNTSDGASAFIRTLARSAGVPEDVLAQRETNELAQQIGVILRLIADNLMQLLSARQQAKRLARTATHTSIDALNNNPLKFSPCAQDALRIMFGPANSSYLDAQRAIGQAFGDLKSHQLKTYSAMQHALSMLMADLDPTRIEREIESGGIGGLLQPRKAKLWDTYQARWQAKVGRQGGEPIEAFMRYFAEYYDRDEVRS